MKIQAISPNFTSSITQNKKEATPTQEKKVCASCQEALAAQNAILVNKLEKFDIESLDDKGILETFTKEEMALPEGGINITPLWNLASGGEAEQIRHIENTGELIPYVVNNLLEKAKRESLSEEQTAQLLKEYKEEFIQKYEEQKAAANAVVDLTAPTTSEHTVYRVIYNYPRPGSEKFFEKIASLKEGQVEKLDCVPLYVSTSGKKVMKNYCSRPNNATLFKIVLPEGSKLFKFPSNDGIEQCLMKADSEFEVLENKQYKDDFRVITLKYIP